MAKVILITGSTDGIGLETARKLVDEGHRVLLHGRNPEKLQAVVSNLSNTSDDNQLESFVADLSRMDDVEAFATAVKDRHDKIDVLINNAGIFKTSEKLTPEGFDVRFAVNTFAPYLLTQKLLPLMSASGRVINLSSAAQSPVEINALQGQTRITDDFSAYAQSKLAITMWSRHLAQSLNESGPVIVAVNPGSLLASKMVKDGFGVEGNDIKIGVDILIRAALSDEFSSATGLYYDNDAGQFASPHVDALDSNKSEEVVRAIEAILSKR